MYQGETIAIDIKGDDSLNLDEVTLTVCVYPTYTKGDKIQVEYTENDAPSQEAPQMKINKVDANYYQCVISSSKSAAMATGKYTVEVMTETKDTPSVTSITQIREAFELLPTKIKGA
jgi:hypothetical protein